MKRMANGKITFDPNEFGDINHVLWILLSSSIDSDTFTSVMSKIDEHRNAIYEHRAALKAAAKEDM